MSSRKNQGSRIKKAAHVLEHRNMSGWLARFQISDYFIC